MLPQNKEVKGIDKEGVEEDDKNVLPNKWSRVILRGKIIMAIFNEENIPKINKASGSQTKNEVIFL